MSSDNEQLLLDLVKDYRSNALGLRDEYIDLIADLEDKIQSLASVSLNLQSELEREKSATKNEQIKNAGFLKIIEAYLDKIKPINPPGDWRLWAYGTAAIYFKDQLSLWNYYISNKDNLKVGDQ